MDRTALLDAAKKGDAETVKALIDAGADINAKDNDGQTAISYATENGYAETVKALIDAGATVENYTELFNNTSVNEALQRLKKIRDNPVPEMYTIISNIEEQFSDCDSYELEYHLGSALQTYSIFVCDDERRLYLQKAIQHLEKAYNLSKGIIPEELPVKDRHKGLISRNMIACEIGYLLINNRIIRDIDKGIFYLETVFNNTNDYYPAFCSYADAYYKLGDYNKAAEIALESHRRAKESPEWGNIIPSVPIEIAAKAYRAQAKEYKRNGEFKQAILLFEKLVDMNFATENDKKILKDLKSYQKI